MFSIFKKKEKATFYFSGHPPKNRIDSFILEFIKPVFEKHQFKFKESDFSFEKAKDDFKQAIHFKRSRYNSKDEIVRFDIIFSLFDKNYNEWHKTFYKEKAATSQLYGQSAAHIKAWDTKFMDNTWYDLASTDNKKIIEVINSNIEIIGLPTLDRLSNRQNAFNELRRTSFNICPILFDYCIFENDKMKAGQIIEDFESYLHSKYKDQYEGQLETYEIRKKIYKNWA